MLLMSLVPRWLPNIHPVLVHFPIVLFFLAVLLDFLSFFLPANWWDEGKTMIIYVLGVISVVVVYFTGKMAQGTLHNLSPAAQHAVQQHLMWGLRTLWFFVIYVLIRLFLYLTKRMRRVGLRVIMFLISLAGLFLLYKTGEHGGALVYKYGLSTRQKIQVSDSGG